MDIIFGILTVTDYGIENEINQRYYVYVAVIDAVGIDFIWK